MIWDSPDLQKWGHCLWSTICCPPRLHFFYIRGVITETLNKYFTNEVKAINLKLINPENTTDINEILMKERSTLLNIQNTIAHLGRTTWLNNVWKELQGIVIGRCDKVEFDTNPNVIASDNNIKYNFKTGEFSQTVIDDYISLSTKNDWAHPGRHTATHWRSRVSWGPTCGPSHIDLLQVDAISGASRPAFVPWAGPTCAGPTGARCLSAPKGL